MWQPSGLKGGPAVAVLKLAASLWCNQPTASFGGGSHQVGAQFSSLDQTIQGSFWI